MVEYIAFKITTTLYNEVEGWKEYTRSLFKTPKLSFNERNLE